MVYRVELDSRPSGLHMVNNFPSGGLDIATSVVPKSVSIDSRLKPDILAPSLFLRSDPDSTTEGQGLYCGCPLLPGCFGS